MIRMTESEASAAGIPFPSTPEDKAAADRHLAKLRRANDLALGKVAPNKAERARMQRKADKDRGWRVLVPSARAADPLWVIGVDPGKRGGWALWKRMPHGWFMDSVGDLDWRANPWTRPHRWSEDTLVVLEERLFIRNRGRVESTTAEGWGRTAATLEAVCRARGWPMIAVEPRTWQVMLRPALLSIDQQHPHLRSDRNRTKWAAHNTLRRVLDPDTELRSDFYGARGGYLDGRGDAACIGWWATQNLPAILAECAKEVIA